MPAVGSSRKINAGSCTKAAARARRRCIPPEASRTRLSRSSVSSTQSRSWRRRRLRRSRSAVHRGVEAEVLPQRQLGEQRRDLRQVPDAGPLGVAELRSTGCRPPTPRRSSARSRPVSRRTVVVLPHPLGPIRPTIVPAWISRSTSRTTGWSSNDFPSSRQATIAGGEWSGDRPVPGTVPMRSTVPACSPGETPFRRQWSRSVTMAPSVTARCDGTPRASVRFSAGGRAPRLLDDRSRRVDPCDEGGPRGAPEIVGGSRRGGRTVRDGVWWAGVQAHG